MKERFEQIINELSVLKTNLFQNDFILTWEKSESDIRKILLTAEALRILREKNISSRCFEAGIAVSIFRDQSTRTRFSFASGANLLGLSLQDFDESRSQISHGETIRETANMISFLTEIIGIRDDIYLGVGNAYMREVAEALSEGFNKGILQQRPGIINLQCDIDHPTQSLSDLLHLINHFGSIEKLRGKKIAMTWAYSPSYGKPLSVPQGIIGLFTRFGMDVHLSYPKGYDLLPDIVALAKKQSLESSGRFTVSESMIEAYKGADIVYSKSWAPMDIMKTRTEFLKLKNEQKLKVLEKEGLEHNSKFMNWTCDEALMRSTRSSSALYMHCLPADISGVSCRNGEVQKEVFEKYRLQTYMEAGYKPFIIASIILNNRFSDVADLLQSKYKQFRKLRG